MSLWPVGDLATLGPGTATFASSSLPSAEAELEAEVEGAGLAGAGAGLGWDSVFSSDSMIFSMVNSGLSILGSGTGGAGAGAGLWAGQRTRNRGSRMASPPGPTKMVPQQILVLRHDACHIRRL